MRGPVGLLKILLSSNMQEGTKEDRKGGGIDTYVTTTKLWDGLVVPPVMCFCPSHLLFWIPGSPPFPCPVQAMHGSNQHK